MQPFSAIGTLVAALLVIAPNAYAQSVAAFYRTNNLSLLIGSGAGGGYDLSGRLVAQHLGRFIPGHPKIVPKNMPAASSLAAAQTVYNVAAKDGATLGIFFPTIVTEKLTDHTLRFEPEKFTWIGRVDSSVLFGLVWHAAPAQTIADVQWKETAMAAMGSSGTAATVPWALNRLLGTMFKVVLGYDSSPAMGLAMERGETDGNGSTSWDYLQTKPQWLEGKVKFLYTIALTRHHKFPDVPTIVELAKNDQDRRVLKLIASSSSIGRSIAAPPGIPEDRAAALRQAFDAMVKDPVFLADAKARNLGVDPLSGAELQSIVKELASEAPEVVERMKSVTRQPR